MKQLFLFLALFIALGVSAQTARIKFKQIAAGNNGQVAMVGVDGNGAWVTPPFMVYSDTTNLVATKTNVNVALLKEVVSASFANGTLTLTKANGGTVTVGLDGRYVLLSSVGQVNGVAPIGADGKIPSTFLPALTGRTTFSDTSQADMLADNAVVGDLSARYDVNKTFSLNALPASNINNWVELPSNTAPVTSVNGLTGNVNLTTTQIAEGTNQYFTVPRGRNALSASGAINYDAANGIFTHKVSGVSANTYNNVTVDAFGHVTNGSNVTYTVPADLAAYYTKTNLQTSGQAIVNWDNVSGKPTTFAGQEEAPQFTGATTNSITLPHTPIATTAVKLFLNGVLLSASDYTQTGANISLGITREASDVIKAVYNF